MTCLSVALVGLLFLYQAAGGIRAAYAVSVPFLLLAGRGLLASVALTPADIIVRSWLRTYRIPRSSIKAVGLVPYSGAWAKGGIVPWLDELALLQFPHQIRDLPPIVGWSRRGGPAERIGVDLAAQLGVPFIDILAEVRRAEYGG